MAKKIKDENGKTYVQKKPFYKRFWFWILIIIIIIGIGSQMDNSSSSKNGSSNNSSSTKSTGITKSSWDKVNLSESTGTSPDSVRSLFNKKASSTSENTIQNVKSKVYTWDNVSGGGLGSSVTVSFSNDHAISKSITGLKTNRPNKISLSDFDAIQNGTSKTDIQKKFGKPNMYSITNLAGSTTEIWEYTSGVKGDAGANFNLTFANDVVSGKTQSSMK